MASHEEHEKEPLVAEGRRPISEGAAVVDPQGAKPHPRRQCILVTFSIMLAFFTGIFFAVGFVAGRPLLGPLFLASIIPSLFILYAAYHKDVYTSDKYSRGVCASMPETHNDKVPLEILIIGLSMGIISTIPVGLIGGLEAWGMEAFAKKVGPLNFPAMMFYVFVEAFIATAILEEGAKYLCAQYSTQKDELQPYIAHPYGVALFGLAVALGFAGLENVTYVLGEGTDGAGWVLAIVRALMAVPLHGTTGALIGVGLARKVYLHEKKWTVPYILRWPVLIHGMYDFVWMAPLRAGPFEGKGKGPMTEKNTADIGALLVVFYIGNMLLVVFAARYAYLECKKLRDEYADELAKAEPASGNV